MLNETFLEYVHLIMCEHKGQDEQLRCQVDNDIEICFILIATVPRCTCTQTGQPS